MSVDHRQIYTRPSRMQTGSWPTPWPGGASTLATQCEPRVQGEAAQNSPAPAESGRGGETLPAANTRTMLQIDSQKLGAESDRHDGTVLDRIPSWLSNRDIIVMRTKCNKKMPSEGKTPSSARSFPRGKELFSVQGCWVCNSTEPAEYMPEAAATAKRLCCAVVGAGRQTPRPR
jgi:hypothetical protein